MQNENRRNCSRESKNVKANAVSWESYEPQTLLTLSDLDMMFPRYGTEFQRLQGHRVQTETRQTHSERRSCPQVSLGANVAPWHSSLCDAKSL